MTHMEELTRQSELLAQRFGEEMSKMREAMGLPDMRTLGYVGNRCGWYPEKPRRKGRKSA